jgi:hypothetical protein
MATVGMILLGIAVIFSLIKQGEVNVFGGCFMIVLLIVGLGILGLIFLFTIGGEIL